LYLPVPALLTHGQVLAANVRARVRIGQTVEEQADEVGTDLALHAARQAQGRERVVRARHRPVHVHGLLEEQAHDLEVAGGDGEAEGRIGAAGEGRVGATSDQKLHDAAQFIQAVCGESKWVEKRNAGTK